MARSKSGSESSSGGPAKGSAKSTATAKGTAAAKEKAGITSGDPRQMVVTLRPESWLDPKRPDVTSAPVTQEILDRVSKKSGLAPGRVQMFPNIGAFAISAEADYIDLLSNEPEVLRADENIQQESMDIKPVRKRPVAFGKRPAGKKK